MSNQYTDEWSSDGQVTCGRFFVRILVPTMMPLGGEWGGQYGSRSGVGTGALPIPVMTPEGGLILPRLLKSLGFSP